MLNQQSHTSTYQLRCVVGKSMYRPLIIPLPKPTSDTILLTIGRGKKTGDVRIRAFESFYQKRLSRKHLSIAIHSNGDFTVTDLKSNNGVMLNGEPLPAELGVCMKAHDLLQLGGVKTGTQGDEGQWPVFVLEKIRSTSYVSPVSSPVAVKTKIQKKSKKRPRMNDETSSKGGPPLKKPITTERESDDGISGGISVPDADQKNIKIRVDDCLGCAQCEDFIIDPIVLRCAHSLCFVCCHRLSKAEPVGECPTCGVDIPKDSTKFHRSVKLDQLVGRYVDSTSTPSIREQYERRCHEHAEYCIKNVQQPDMEVAQKIETEEVVKTYCTAIIVCDSCGREGHEEDECPYVDSEDDDLLKSSDESDDDGW